MSRKVRATILFCDLVQSSDLASFYTLTNYDRLLSEFQRTGLDAAREVIKKLGYRKSWYELGAGGDEIRLFLYSGSPDRDLKCAVLFALVLKVIWHCGGTNKARRREGKLPIDLGIGIHQGDVIYGPHPGKKIGVKNIEGYSINVAKRVEGHAREGSYFKVMVTHPLFELAKTAMRVAGFTEAKKSRLKGIADMISIYELRSFYTQEVFRYFPARFPLDAELSALTKEFGKREVIHWLGPMVMRWNQLKKRDKEALHIGQKMFQLDKENEVVPVAIAKSYEALGDFGRAIYWMKILVSSRDVQPWHTSYLGDLHLKNREYEAAIQAWSITLTSQDESLQYEAHVRKLIEKKISQARRLL